jgi:hypothetical protein
VWITAARSLGESLSFVDARARLEGDGKTVLIVFGTGWGLAPSVLAGGDALLEPIRATRETTTTSASAPPAPSRSIACSARADVSAAINRRDRAPRGTGR